MNTVLIDIKLSLVYNLNSVIWHPRTNVQLCEILDLYKFSIFRFSACQKVVLVFHVNNHICQMPIEEIIFLFDIVFAERA